MSLGKKDIILNISSKAHISRLNSNLLLNAFIKCIKDNSVSKDIKISNFGTFFYKKTPSRIGRNPKTKEKKEISERNVVLFKPSKEFKEFINTNIYE